MLSWIWGKNEPKKETVAAKKSIRRLDKAKVDRPMMEIPDRKNFREFGLQTQVKGDGTETIKFAYESYEAKRSTNSVTILLLGLTGSGKSNTINSLFDKDITTVAEGTSVTKDIIDIVVSMPSEDLGISNSKIHIVDTPGFNDTQGGLEYDAKVIANIKEFFKKVDYRPNFVVLAVNFTDKRLDGDFSSFVKLLQAIKVELVGSVVDKDRPNLLAVLTHLCGAIPSKQKDPSDKIKLVQQLIQTYLGFVDCPVVVGENCAAEYELPKKGDYYVLPNSDIFPYNVYQSMLTLTKGRDPIGHGLVNEAFSKLRKMDCKPEANFHPIVDLPEATEIISRIKKLHLSELTDLGKILSRTWSELEPTEQKSRLKPTQLSKSLELFGYNSCSDLPRTTRGTIELFRCLSPDPGMLTLLQKSIGLQPPEFLTDLLVGRAYDITQDQTTAFSVIAKTNNIFSRIGCYFPSHMDATESPEVEFTCESALSTEDYLQQRLKKLRISIAAPQVSFSYALRNGYNLVASENSTKITAVYEKRLLKLECKSDAVASEQLQEAVKKLPLTYDKTDALNVEHWKQFFKACGTHYVTRVYLGGSITFEVNRSRSVTASADSTEHDGSLGDGLSAFLNSIFKNKAPVESSAGHCQSNESMSNASMTKNSMNIKVQGGNGALATKLGSSSSYEQFQIRLQKWEETLWENPVVSELSIALGEVADVVYRIKPEIIVSVKKAMNDLYSVQSEYEAPAVMAAAVPDRDAAREKNKLESGKCFTGDTLIFTPEGPIPIATIQKDQLVLNKDGNAVRVVALVKVYALGTCKLYGFAGTGTERGHKPFFTSAHPFLGPAGEILVVDLPSLFLSHPQLKHMDDGAVCVKQMPPRDIQLLALSSDTCLEVVTVSHLTSAVFADEALYFLVVEGDGSYVANGFVTFMEMPNFSAWPKTFEIILGTVSYYKDNFKPFEVFDLDTEKSLRKLVYRIKHEWFYVINNNQTNFSKFQAEPVLERKKILESAMNNNFTANLALMLYADCGELLHRHVDQLGMDVSPFLSAAAACIVTEFSDKNCSD